MREIEQQLTQIIVFPFDGLTNTAVLKHNQSWQELNISFVPNAIKIKQISYYDGTANSSGLYTCFANLNGELSAFTFVADNQALNTASCNVPCDYTFFTKNTFPNQIEFTFKAHTTINPPSNDSQLAIAVEFIKYKEVVKK